MKTLDNIQDELAQEIGYLTMREYIHELVNIGSFYTMERLTNYINELSIRLQQEQQKLIAENAKIKYTLDEELNKHYIIDKDSIINENNIIK